jgi:hypothetical protein
MVTAALKFALGENTPSTCSTPDKAKLEILNSLNWLEAHGEYEWPDFQQDGLDFTQAMRLRRALVSDVFVALNRSDNLKISSASEILGTPESGQDIRGQKRSRSNCECSRVSQSSRAEQTADTKRETGCKRRCKREDDSEPENESYDGDFLVKTMKELIKRSEVEIHKKDNPDDFGDRGPDLLADRVHDCLVGKWSHPVGIGLLSQGMFDRLKQKQDTWAHVLSTEPTSSSGLRAQRTMLRSERVERSSVSR